MSALDVLNSVLSEIGISKTSPELSDNTDADVVEIRNFMNLAGQEIARRADFSKLFVDAGTGGNISEYTLPDAFCRIPSKGTTVKLNKSGVFTPVIPVVSDASWALIKYKNPSDLYYYHQISNKIVFAPTLDGDGAIVTYISKYWVEDNVTGREVIQDNGDTLLIPESLVQKGAVWRWMRKKGLPYEDHFSEFEADLKTELDSNRGVA